MNPLEQIAKYARNTLAAGAILAGTVVPSYAASKSDVEKAIKIIQKSGTSGSVNGYKTVSMETDSGLELFYFPGDKKLEVMNTKRFLDGKSKCVYIGYDKDLDGILDVKGNRGKMQEVQGLYDDAISQIISKSN